jgi:hypothetical protein
MRQCIDRELSRRRRLGQTAEEAASSTIEVASAKISKSRCKNPSRSLRREGRSVSPLEETQARGTPDVLGGRYQRKRQKEKRRQRKPVESVCEGEALLVASTGKEKKKNDVFVSTLSALKSRGLLKSNPLRGKNKKLHAFPPLSPIASL